MLLFQSSPRFESVKKLSELRPDVKLNLLDSFALLSNQSVILRKTERDIFNLYAHDSGAYSINHATNPAVSKLSAQDYSKHLSVVGKYYDLVFNFDSDFKEVGFDENYKRQLELENNGFKIVPVVHDIYGEELRFYIEKGYEHIAIGSSQTREPHDVKIAILDSYQNVRLHLFGRVGFDYLAYLPIWSCDASSWAQYVKYGYIMYWDEHRPGVNKGVALGFSDRQVSNNYKIKVESYVNKEHVMKYLDKNLGMSYDDLVGDDSEINRQIVNMLYFYEFEKRITQIHNDKGWFFD